MKTTIKQIEGSWDLGYALDKHTLSSQYIGDNAQGHAQYDTTRSQAGEALYQLKYKRDWSQIEPLAHELATKIYPKFDNVGLIVPMPPSKKRARQPVTELASALGKIVNLHAFDQILRKTDTVTELKDLTSKQEKTKALENLLTVSDGIQGTGRWNALILDDLFDTGASLEAACTALRGYAKINKIYVATITWK